MNEKRIVSIGDYGKAELCLGELMDKRGISRNQLARAVNTRFEVIDKWYRGNVEKLDLDILSRICCVLDCTPADIIVYRK